MANEGTSFVKKSIKYKNVLKNMIAAITVSEMTFV